MVSAEVGDEGLVLVEMRVGGGLGEFGKLHAKVYYYNINDF